MALLTLHLAKDHLRVTTDDNDADIWAKTQQAEQSVLDRCNTTARMRTLSATWTDDTVPLAVQAAILVMLTHLYEHRGDDMATEAAVLASIDRLIGPLYRDPVIA